MFKMSQLKKKISLESTLSAADILKKLEDLTGLVYLYDDNNPIIGFLPKKYLIAQGHQNFIFEQDTLNKYINSPNVESILDFTQFHTEESKNKKISFNGGYIGFISYDFSAHQFIKNQSHRQPSLFIGSYHS
ncbi:aminodeoxychorismate synthase component I, partial [Acinetobacter seifertii]